MNGLDPTGLFNPTKYLSGLGNYASVERLYASGLLKLFGAAGLLETGVGAPGSIVAAVLGSWNIYSAANARARGRQQCAEALNEDWDDASLKNFYGMLPWRTHADDANEPNYFPMLFGKLGQVARGERSIWELIGEMGTAAP